MEAISVAIGAAFGGLLRLLFNKLFVPFQHFFPFATLLANVLSSFIVGLVYAYLLIKNPQSNFVKPFLITGFCGGLSTFSTFSYENLFALEQGRVILFILNVLLNLVLCLLATWLGTTCLK